MNAEEMLEVFALINAQHPAAPHKKGRDEVNAWLAVLDQSMGYGEAHAALREWYAAQSSFITPAALNNIVRSQRASRMAAERRAAMGEASHVCGAMRCHEKGVSFRDWAARNPELAHEWGRAKREMNSRQDVNQELTRLGY